MDWLVNDALPVLARIFIVWIFPFSFLDKIINWDSALKQATSSWLPGGPVLLILAMIVELLTPPMIVFGFYDGIAAFILAGYCVITGIVYHAFWTYPRFWSPESEGYPHIWDFFKNFAIVGGLIFVMYASGFIQATANDIEKVAAADAARGRRGGARMSLDPKDPKIPYWHLWTGDDGATHQTRCELTNFEWQSMGGKAASQWNDDLLSGQTSLLFCILPVGWNGDWHENPKPQWISVLSGRWFVELTDGTRVEMGKGDLAFGGDQNARPDAKAGSGIVPARLAMSPVRC